ncbi:MAG TPA: hypothetical protein VHQ47_05155 [Phycisphaerae bacterium]|nr:hypothetical protein [Phycisphaerae bacterium]
MPSKCLPLLALLLLAPLPAHAAAQFQEDLSKVALPHGDLVLPLPGTFEAAHGTMLKFADGKLHAAPTDNGRPIAPMDLPKILQKENIADLAYIDADSNEIWSISGRISELGTCYLSDAAALTVDKPFDRPLELTGDATHPAGLFKPVVEGRTYLVEATDGKFALVRIIEKSPVGLHIQYVYQPNGTAKFSMPAQQLVDVLPVTPLTAPAPETPPAPAAAASPATPAPINGMATAASAALPDAGAPIASLTAPQTPPAQPSANSGSISGITLRMDGPAGNAQDAVLEPPMNTYLAERSAMIQHRMQLLASAANTPAGQDQKTQAIADLGALHAAEAADTLARQITYLDARKTKDLAPESVHPAFAALIKIGKPGADAALKALRSMDLTPPADTSDVTQSPEYRARLLALVIRDVEGDEVADFLLKREAARTPDPRRRALYEALLGQIP